MCIVLIFAIPSATAATEYEYPDYIWIAENVLGHEQGEIIEGNLNSFRYVDGDAIHFRGGSDGQGLSILIYLYFNPAYINTYESPGELKITYDYTGGSFLRMTIIYWGLEGLDSTDFYNLIPPGGYERPNYYTETFVTRADYKGAIVQLNVNGCHKSVPPKAAHLWIDYLGVKYTCKDYIVGPPGCPILSVFDGVQYQEEGLLDIHDPEGNDIVFQHDLINSPVAIDNRFHLRLTEHPNTISHIDRVELWGELSNNRMIKLPLLSAIHCELGQVVRDLRCSDERKVEIKGGEHNDGISQTLDLMFLAPSGLNFNKFIFIIEGNNAFVK